MKWTTFHLFTLFRSVGLLVAISALFAVDKGLLRAEERTNKPSRAFFWRVQGKSNSLYIFGTTALALTNQYQPEGEITAAFKKSKTVVVQVDPARLEAETVRKRFISLGTYPPGESITNYVGNDVLQKLHSYVAKDPERRGVAYWMKPWLLLQHIVIWELETFGAYPTNQVNDFLLREALLSGKRIEAFESPESIFNWIEGFTQAEEAEILRTTLLGISDLQKQMEEESKAWLRGDRSTLDKLYIDEVRRSPLDYKKAVAERNPRWLTKIKQLSKDDGDVFMVVPYLNLMGTGGLLQMLKESGFLIDGP